jgi:GPH family glycoside/pentoside/hexuronide:cation symporter
MPTYLAYALLGMPLAFFALPLYVHVPKLYADNIGLPLASVGLILLSTRLLDAVLDPLIGRWSDGPGRRKKLLVLAAPLLLLGWGMLFMPPADASLLWLGSALVVAYAGYSLAMINYQAWGAEFPADEQGRLRASAWREGAALIGVMLAAALPALLADSLPQGLYYLSWLFMPLLIGAFMLALAKVPLRPASAAHDAVRERPRLPVWQVFRSAPFRLLLLIYALNGIAAAVPATLVLFYVADVLQADAWGGVFLLLYFLSGAFAMPFWVQLAGRYGRLHAWWWAMGLAMAGFAVTPFLGGGDIALFALVCVVSGIAVGADLVLPPALLAEHIALHGQAGASFGWWTAITKLNLALAAGISLPLLAWLGYTPGALHGNSTALAWVYGGLPLLLKLLTASLLFYWRHSLLILDGRKRACANI